MQRCQAAEPDVRRQEVGPNSAVRVGIAFSQHGQALDLESLVLGILSVGKPSWGVRPVKFRVLIEQDEDGAFVTEVPSLPGCVTQGATREQALANTREAIAGYLESLQAHGEPIPPSIDEEVVDVAI